MNATETALNERIRSFAASVRTHLGDLPGDEVEEIISGLIADLTDQANDSDGALELGDPGEYAAELRAAAGLPERVDGATRVPLRERVRAWREHTAARIRQNPAAAWVLDLLVSLRPAWWVLRGWGLYAAGNGIVRHSGPIPRTLVGWLTLGVLFLISVQWGRGRWLPQNFVRHVRTVASVIALLALPFAITSATAPQFTYISYEEGPTYEEAPAQGLLLDGVQVGNIFAYDENGDPIDRVQLFTDKGTPLNLYGADSKYLGYDWSIDDEGRVHVPWADSFDRDTWNVYPLRTGEPYFDEDSSEASATDEQDATAPFVRAPNTLAARPAPTEAGTPSPIPSPTEAADSTPEGDTATSPEAPVPADTPAP